jgi:hypothetical protein
LGGAVGRTVAGRCTVCGAVKLDDAVRTAEEAVSAQATEMEQTREKFLSPSVTWLTEALPKALEDSAKQLHEHTLSLGKDGVPQLKKDFADKMAILPEIVDETTGCQSGTESGRNSTTCLDARVLAVGGMSWRSVLGVGGVPPAISARHVGK